MSRSSFFKRNSRLGMLLVAWYSLAGGMRLTAEDCHGQGEVLQITIGKPTLLDPEKYQNAACVAVSRTGVLAAFYPKPPKHYRTSDDGGVTWGAPRDSPPQLAGGAPNIGLREGGVLMALTPGIWWRGEAEFHVSRMDGGFKNGWFSLHSTFAWFNDDFTKYAVAPVQVYLPDAVTTKQIHLPTSSWPIFDKGKILQLSNGDLLAPMYGVFNGDTKSRAILSCSTDQGHTWRYYATIAYEPTDPHPELPGQYEGPCEPSIALLPTGKMLCVMRTQYSHLPGEYRPLSISWSDDLGKTWTTPIATHPHLMNISPTLAVLDNGVVACQYGRPGFHVVFSINDGQTWRDRISFSNLPEPHITGQFDMVKSGPNQLVAIGNDSAGTQVWPIDVQRRKVPRTSMMLTGRIIDQGGVPLAGANVALGPQRYTADSWEESNEENLFSAAPSVNPPELGYQSISRSHANYLATTDADGRFELPSIQCVEYVMTVEAIGYAPQWRSINLSHELQQRRHDFQLTPGRSVRGRVVDLAQQPLGGVCVIVNKRHIHADSDGFFHLSIDAPVPRTVSVKAYKRYSDAFLPFEETLLLSQIEERPLVLRPKK